MSEGKSCGCGSGGRGGGLRQRAGSVMEGLWASGFGPVSAVRREPRGLRDPCAVRCCSVCSVVLCCMPWAWVDCVMEVGGGGGKHMKLNDGPDEIIGGEVHAHEHKCADEMVSNKKILVDWPVGGQRGARRIRPSADDGLASQITPLLGFELDTSRSGSRPVLRHLSHATLS